MPSYFNRMRKSKRSATTDSTAVGPAAYAAATRPTLTFPDLFLVEDVADVVIHNDGNYVCRPLTIANNVMTYGVYSLRRAAASGAMGNHVSTQPNNHAVHTHVTHFQTAAAANAVTAAGNQLRTPAAAFDVAGVVDSAGEGGVVQAAAMAHAGAAVDAHANAAAALLDTPIYEEVRDATNLSGVHFWGWAEGL